MWGLAGCRVPSARVTGGKGIALVWASGNSSRVAVDSKAAGARWAQQLEQQQQLQRTRSAPRDRAGRVEVSAKFASMPTRTSVHTSTVNSTPGMWDMFHLIRFTSQVKGLFPRLRGHMAHNQAH
ncbi:hypothetical protein GCM10023084_43780 [Streptomyces lacrimifluminis]|uniref:Uncharacterized protein n=1 Tax=Streptomyces lacrimifluminis TaxID=1500077 RepID=A0A917KFZ6_9ACTN|nr:hypothetical protein GCM10012282_06370 [Streptomyces lacrimifluminis]